MLKVGICGAAGRMGRRLVALGQADPALTIAAAVDGPTSPELGRDAGEVAGIGPLGVVIAKQLTGPLDVVIDFSLPVGTRGAIAWCIEHKTPLLVGTTGLSADDDDMITQAGKTIPVLRATNFSLVVNVLWKLAAEAAQLLGPEYDIEVLEAHHRFKKDAPSGTAHTLVQKLCEATGRDYEKDVLYTRHGDDVPRQPNQITVQTLRIGDHAGEHTAYFAAIGERLEIKHVSTSRDSYVLGALRAAKWLCSGGGKQPGRYDMKDVLGL